MIPNQDSEEAESAHEDHDRVNSNYYGVAPGIAGILFGLALIAFMFALADGFV